MATKTTKIQHITELEIIAEIKGELLSVETGGKLGLWTQGKGGRHFEQYRVMGYADNIEMDKDGNVTNLTKFVCVVTEKEYIEKQMKQK